MLYILIAIVVFGILIALHEFGHFITAKLLGVRVNEFAIGMGPLLWSTTKGETQYSLRAIPIGGFCAMEGEDEDSDDPGCFSNKPGWKKCIILVAGSAMNFLTGLVILLLLSIPVTGYQLPVVEGFLEGYGIEDCGLQPGDRFLKIDGHSVWIYGDAAMLLGRAGDTVDLVVERDGVEVLLEDVFIPLQARETEEGTTWLRGLHLGSEIIPATVGTRLVMSAYQAADMVRMVWFSLSDLVRGAVGVQDMSGVIGIMDVMGQAGEAGAQAAEESGGSPFLGALMSILNLSAFIAINLAVMNLLPIPALDGGRIFFLAVNWLFTLVTRRRLDPKYEGYVHMAGFLFLLLLMVVVAFNDVVRIVT